MKANVKLFQSYDQLTTTYYKATFRVQRIWLILISDLNKAAN